MKSARIYDTIKFLSKLRIAKVYTSAKLLGSFYLMKWTHKPSVSGLPMTLSFEPTTACNLRCPECPSGLRTFTRPTGKLKLISSDPSLSKFIKADLLNILFLGRTLSEFRFPGYGKACFRHRNLYHHIY